MASAVLESVVRLNSTGFRSSLAGLKTAVKDFKRQVAEPFAEAGAKLGAFAKKAALAGTAMTALGVHQAFKIEGIETQFTTLLGSASKAKKRVEEILAVAATTPFDLTSYTEAARIMQTVGGDALGSTQFLSKLGDTASAVGADLQQTATWTAKLYSSLKSGSGTGNSGDDMMRAGILRPETFEKLKQMSRTGADFQQMWALVNQDLSRFNGSMAKMSQTGKGQIATLKGLLQIGLAQSFKELGNAVSSVLGRINQYLMDLYRSGTFKRWGQEIGKVASDVLNFVERLMRAFRALSAEQQTQLMRMVAAAGAAYVAWRAGFLLPMLKGLVMLSAFTITHCKLMIGALLAAVAAFGAFNLGKAFTLMLQDPSMTFADAFKKAFNDSLNSLTSIPLPPALQALINNFKSMAGTQWAGAAKDAADAIAIAEDNAAGVNSQLRAAAGILRGVYATGLSGLAASLAPAAKKGVSSTQKPGGWTPGSAVSSARQSQSSSTPVAALRMMTPAEIAKATEAKRAVAAQEKTAGAAEKIAARMGGLVAIAG